MPNDASPTLDLPPDYALPDPPAVGGARRRKTLSRIDAALSARFARQPDVLVSGGGYMRRDPFDEAERLAPDCLVAFGVEDPDKAIDRNGYIMGEVGKPPDFVLDVASGGESPGADAYAQYGARERWRLLETAGRDEGDDAVPLIGDKLVRGEYVPIPIRRDPDGLIWGFSEALGLRVCWDGGGLRFADPDTGSHLPDAEGLRRRADAAEALAAVSQAGFADSQSIVSETRARLAETEARMADIEARMEAAEARLAASEADIAEIKARVQAAEARADAQAASDHIREMMLRRPYD